MSNLVIRGGQPLAGALTPSANKNAILPILCATLLSREPITLNNVPDITDVRRILDVFRELGSDVNFDIERKVLHLAHRDTQFDPKLHHLPVQMRSSIMLVPPLLARFGVALIKDDVKGCSLGVREVDPHIEVFQRFGATIHPAIGELEVRCSARFQANKHWLDYASVTTTENFVLSAALAQGTSTLNNAASEPHVQEFCAFMAQLGAQIEGIGTSHLTVHGVDQLGGCEFTLREDFHEIATLLALGAISGGRISVKNSAPEHFPLIDRTFAKLGIHITHENGWSTVESGQPLKVQSAFTANVLPKIEAAPWPYLPVDLLPIFIALGVKAEGSIMFWNKVYDGALGWTTELSKFGAHVFQSDPHRLITFGNHKLTPAQVESPYIIRVAIALLMVASSIEGRSVIKNATPIRRAHPGFAENLRALGADVEWEIVAD